MEQLLFRVHTRVLTVSNRYLSPSLRRSLEAAVLLAALATITGLVLLHITYVLHSNDVQNNCVLSALDRYEHFAGTNESTLHPLSTVLDPGGGIAGEGAGENASQWRERARERLRRDFDLIALKIDPPPSSSSLLLSSLLALSPSQWTHVQDQGSSANKHTTAASAAIPTEEQNCVVSAEKEQSCASHTHTNAHTKTHTDTHRDTLTDGTRTEREIAPGIRVSQFTSSSRHYTTRTPHTFLFSFSRASLMLTQEPPSQHHYHFSTLQLTFQPRECACFGPWWSAELVNLFPSLYDVVIMNWALRAFRPDQSQQENNNNNNNNNNHVHTNDNGFLFNVKTREIFNLNYASQFVAKKGVNIAEKSLSRRERLRSASAVSEFVSATTQSVYERVAWVTAWYRENLLPIVWKESTHTERDASERENESNHTENTHGHGVERERALLSRVLSLAGDLLQFLMFRTGVLFSTTFIFFVSSSLVSYVLRETQERMLRFTFLLQYHITRNLPYHSLLFTHVTSSLIFVPIIMGIYFFMFEFFADQLLAFLVLLVVWMGEVFSILSLRSEVSIKYFPKIFCFYFYLFHIYFFSFPFGFVYPALLGLTLLVLHSMMHFWNAFEVPVFYSGRISALHPRIYSYSPTELPHAPPTTRSTPATPTSSSRTQTPSPAASQTRTQTHTPSNRASPTQEPSRPLSVSATHTPERPVVERSASERLRNAPMSAGNSNDTSSNAEEDSERRPRARSLSSAPAPLPLSLPFSLTVSPPRRVSAHIHESLEARRARLAAQAQEKEKEKEKKEENEKAKEKAKEGEREASMPAPLSLLLPQTCSPPSLSASTTHDSHSHTETLHDHDEAKPSLSVYTHTQPPEPPIDMDDGEDYGFFLEGELSPTSPLFESSKHTFFNNDTSSSTAARTTTNTRVPTATNHTTEPVSVSRHRFVCNAINHVDSNLHKYTVSGGSSHLKSNKAVVPVQETQETPRGGDDKKFTIFGSFDDMY